MTAPLFPQIVVNGETVPQAAIAAEAQNQEAPAGKPGVAWRKAAQAMVVRTLLKQEAARRGLVPQPRDLGAGRRETDEEAAIRALLDAELTAAPPDEDSVRAAYDAAPDRFRAPTLYEASHILLAPAGAEAERLAADTLAELSRRPEAFEQLARARSACGSKEAGGRLGQFSSGDMDPAFEAALETLREGEIAAAPVATRHGLHVVRLDARAPGARLPYEAVRGHIAAALERAAWAREARGFVARLAAEAEIAGVRLDAA